MDDFKRPAIYRFLLLIAITLIAGCADFTRAPGPNGTKNDFWQGRIAVRVAATPAQAFSANFEMQGSAQNGRMELTTALGTTVARMQWGPAGAELLASGSRHTYPSLADMTLDTMGAELPVEALFAWLKGQAAAAQGWQVNLGEWDAGRITAQRVSPDPPVDLKILLER